MRIFKLFQGILGVALPFAAAGCDDGKIYPSETGPADSDGFTVVMNGEITGIGDSYDSKYSVVIAGFEDGNEYAAITKRVKEGSDAIELTNVPTDVSTIELCVINTLRERVMTLKSFPVSAESGERVTVDAGNVDVSPFAAIVSDVFSTTCIQCHGGAGHAAAGLDLQPETAYGMLVNVPSAVVEDEKRVDPGNAGSSTLWQAVATDRSQVWSFDHSNLLTSEKSGFIEYWINNLVDD